MWNLPATFWIGVGAALICLFVQDAVAKENRYSKVFAKMEAEFEAMKGITDIVEIRHMLFNRMKATGDFEKDPCDDFVEYSCGGYYKDVDTSLPEIEPALYDYEIFKFQMKQLFGNENAFFEGEVAEKLKTFFNSCLTFSDLQKPEGILRKLFGIVDNAGDWKEAVLNLHTYGIKVFYKISYDDGIKISPLPQRRIFGPLLNVTEFLPDVEMHKYDEEVFQGLANLTYLFEGVTSLKSELPGVTYNLAEVDKAFPALNIEKVLNLYAVGLDHVSVTILDIQYFKEINDILMSIDKKAVNLFLKAVIFEKVFEKLEYILDTESDSSRFDKCFEVAYQYFEPTLNKIYAQNFVSDEMERTSNLYLRKAMDVYMREVGGMRSENGRNLRENMDHIFLASERSNLLYEFLNLDPEQEFPDQYFDVVFSDNRQRMKCLGLLSIRMGEMENAKMVKMSELKNFELCSFSGLKFIPIHKLNVPFYHISYPEFWNYASISWAYYWHVLKPMEETMASIEKVNPMRLWDTFGLTGSIEHYTTYYYSINITSLQASFIAVVQNACYQAGESQLAHLSSLTKTESFKHAFNCNVL